jgi:DNA topoisomerase-2
MYEAIVSMAQNHTGSNNLSWLVPLGQFGSRLDKRSVHAQCRYLFTQIDPISRIIFRPEDDLILQYVEEDGQKVEPRHYIPIIPTILVNGSEGIGTGWSTNVPPYKPADLVNCMLSMLNGVSAEESASSLIPWWRGFTGDIVQTENGFDTWGKWEIFGNSVVITELPPKTWTDHFLVSMNKHPMVTDVENEKLFSTVNITLSVDQQLLELDYMEIGKQLGLITHWNTGNMHAFDGNGRLQKYTTVSFISEFFQLRLGAYTTRKEILVQRAEFESILCEEKARFIRLVVSGDLAIMRVPRAEIEERLRELGFMERGETYNHLLDMPIKSLTAEAAARLEQRAKDARDELERLINTSETDMWNAELEELLTDLKQLESVDYGEQPGIKRSKKLRRK